MLRSFQLLLRRYPLAWWLAAIGVSAFTGLVVMGSVSRSYAAAERLGGMVEVQVAAIQLPGGVAVTQGQVRTEPWPRALLPDAPLEPDPVGKIVMANVPAGTPLSVPLFAHATTVGPAGMLRPDERGVAFSRSPTTPSLVVGDFIDLYASTDDNPGRSSALLVGSGLRVIDVRDDAVTAAAGEEETATLAATSGDRLIAVLRLPVPFADSQKKNTE